MRVRVSANVGTVLWSQKELGAVVGEAFGDPQQEHGHVEANDHLAHQISGTTESTETGAARQWARKTANGMVHNWLGDTATAKRELLDTVRLSCFSRDRVDFK